MGRRRIGRQTPTSSFALPHKESLYHAAVELYEKTGRKAQEWQVNLLKPIFGLNEDKLWTHTRFGYSLPRRNGKNEVVAIREMWGLVNGERILHTAHRTTTSHAAWERLMALLDAAKIDYNSLRAIGRERIDIDGKGRIEFRTRSSKGGLGEGFDLLVIDEAQEYTDDQESALKYVVTDSSNPQTILCGTPPTPISAGTVFMAYRNKAGLGGLPNAGWAEWGVEQESDPEDRDLWYETNPSLGTILTERSVADEIGDDPIDFNIQRLGLWLQYNQKSAISEGDWENLRVSRLPKLTGPLFLGVKYGHDGVNVAASIAVKTKNGKIFVESIDCRSVRAGTDWLVNFISQAEIEKVVIDGASGQQLLAREMEREHLRPPILPKVKEVIVANAAFERAIYQDMIRHKGQPSLAQVITNCDKRPIGSSGGFGYSSQFEEYDIALMDSAILAHWICLESRPQIAQKVSY